MINSSEMLRQADIEARLPVPTDQQVQDNLSSKIDVIRRSVELPIRMGYTDEYIRSLFSITAEKYVCLKGMDWRKGYIWRVESDRLQQLGIGVMKEYGLDETNSRPEYCNGSWTKGGIIDDRDGTSREMRLYPSQTIDGLAFERVKKFVNTTGEVLSVEWSVFDKAPLFRIRLRKKLGKK